MFFRLTIFLMRFCFALWTHLDIMINWNNREFVCAFIQFVCWIFVQCSQKISFKIQRVIKNLYSKLEKYGAAALFGYELHEGVDLINRVKSCGSSFDRENNNWKCLKGRRWRNIRNAYSALLKSNAAFYWLKVTWKTAVHYLLPAYSTRVMMRRLRHTDSKFCLHSRRQEFIPWRHECQRYNGIKNPCRRRRFMLY